jgi:hypothetical protein
MADRNIVKVLYVNDSEVGKRLLFGREIPKTTEDFTEGYVEAACFYLRGSFKPFELAEDIFRQMQGMFMSDTMLGHMKNMFDKHVGMTHTSMSVGDMIVIEKEDNDGNNKERIALLCANVGFVDMTKEYEAAIAA